MKRVSPPKNLSRRHYYHRIAWNQGVSAASHDSGRRAARQQDVGDSEVDDCRVVDEWVVQYICAGRSVDGEHTASG